MTAKAEFWNWFLENEEMLLNFVLDRENIFDQLAAELQKVDQNLCFEFGPKETTTREFVISAGGIKDSFPAVISLVNAAPVLKRWKLTPFRPRRASLNTVEFRDKCVDPNDVQFSLLNNGKIVGIYIYIPGFQESDLDLNQIAYLLLDECLGEYDVETRLGLIKRLSPDAETKFARYPLVELPTRFDELSAKLEGRSGMPS